MKQAKSKAARLTLFTAGFLFVAVGILGIFLPVLPTTVWLLLAAGCWMRSSPKFYRWLIHNRVLGSYVRNYREYHGITQRQRIGSLVVLWAGITVSAVFLVSRLWLSLLLFAIAIGVSIHLIALKTLKYTKNGASPTAIENERVGRVNEAIRESVE